MSPEIPVFEEDNYRGTFNPEKAEFITRWRAWTRLGPELRALFRLPGGQFIWADCFHKNSSSPDQPPEYEYHRGYLIPSAMAVQLMAELGIRPPEDLFDEFGLEDFTRTSHNPKGSNSRILPEANEPDETEPPRKPGRPHDPTKHEVVKYVRELRNKNTPWKAIPDSVFDKFQCKYTAETLRGYLKSG